MKREPIPQHVRKAREIEREQDANAITALLQRYQVVINGTDVQFLQPVKGLSWTVDTIAGYLRIENRDRVNRALLVLVEKQWVQRRGRQFFITLFGVDQYRMESKSTSINTGAADMEFRREALTDCDKWGKQSSLTNAALDKGSHYESHRNRVEEDQHRRCMTLEEIHAIALDNDCTDEEAVSKMATGEIHECCRCRKWRRHHAANEKNGKRWQSGCITCRKVKP